jgi:hypothetical protein
MANVDDSVLGMLNFLREEKRTDKVALTPPPNVEQPMDESEEELSFDFLRGKAVTEADIAFVKQEPAADDHLLFLCGKSVDLNFPQDDPAEDLNSSNSRGVDGRDVIEIDDDYVIESPRPARQDRAPLDLLWRPSRLRSIIRARSKHSVFSLFHLLVSNLPDVGCRHPSSNHRHHADLTDPTYESRPSRRVTWQSDTDAKIGYPDTDTQSLTRADCTEDRARCSRHHAKVGSDSRLIVLSLSPHSFPGHPLGLHHESPA